MKYSDQLKDARWDMKRKKVLNYADHRCQACGAEQVALQVHHSYYRDGLMAWEYPDGSLIALCDDCHGRVIHGINAKPSKALTRDGLSSDGRPLTRIETLARDISIEPCFEAAASLTKRELIQEIYNSFLKPNDAISSRSAHRVMEIWLRDSKIVKSSTGRYSMAPKSNEPL